MTVYIYADKASIASELVAAAAEMGQESVLLVIGKPDGFSTAGADKIIVLKGTSERPEDYASALADIVKDSGAVAFLASSTVRGREIAARIASSLDCGMASDVSELVLDGESVFASRAVYGGAVVNKVSSNGFMVATVASGAFEALDRPETSVIEEVSVETDSDVVRISVDALVKGTVDLSKAERVVSVGLGLDKEEDLALIRQLAEKLGAEIGCTRDFAESRGWLPKEQYIGITGAIIKPALYVGVGLSGAMQHTYGIRDAKIVVGINKAKDAAIFRTADYGVVGDLYEVVPALIEAL